MSDPQQEVQIMLQKFFMGYEDKAGPHSLDPRAWKKMVLHYIEKLGTAVESGKKDHILRDAVFLTFYQSCFNLTSVSSAELGLFPDEERAEINEMLEEAEKVYAEAMKELPEGTNLFEAWRRVYLYLTKEKDGINMGDLV